MTSGLDRLWTVGVLGAGATIAAYRGLVSGAYTLDLGIGRRSRPLGPQVVEVRAPREVVFDIIAQPYLGRPTRALQDKIRVLERGSDMVLAAHYTPVRDSLTAVTVETVRFTRPERVDFRLVRGPVPHVVEAFVLTEADRGTRLEYSGEIAADLWALGRWWAEQVARRWERAVAESFTSIKTEAERRAAAGATGRR